MIVISQLSDQDVGREVIYQDAGNKAPEETGTISSWNQNFVFVKFKRFNYAPAENGTACKAETLRFSPRKKLYSVDIKIYRSIPSYECPYSLPKSMLQGNHLRVGYHTEDLFYTEEESNALQRWVFDNEDVMKIIGMRKIE